MNGVLFKTQITWTRIWSNFHSGTHPINHTKETLLKTQRLPNQVLFIDCQICLTIYHHHRSRLLWPVNLLDDSDLVEVEDEPGQVAHGEHGHYQHQHHGHPVLTPSPTLPPPPDRDVDPGVEEADGHEGEEAKHQQPRPVNVPRHVSLVHPENI